MPQSVNYLLPREVRLVDVDFQFTNVEFFGPTRCFRFFEMQLQDRHHRQLAQFKFYPTDDSAVRELLTPLEYDGSICTSILVISLPATTYPMPFIFISVLLYLTTRLSQRPTIIHIFSPLPRSFILHPLSTIHNGAQISMIANSSSS